MPDESLRLLMPTAMRIVLLMLVVVGPRDKQRTTVARAALLPAQVRRRRERLGEALLRAGGVEDLGAPGLALVHDAGVLELLDEGFFSSLFKKIIQEN